MILTDLGAGFTNCSHLFLIQGEQTASSHNVATAAVIGVKPEVLWARRINNIKILLRISANIEGHWTGYIAECSRLCFVGHVVHSRIQLGLYINFFLADKKYILIVRPLGCVAYRFGHFVLVVFSGYAHPLTQVDLHEPTHPLLYTHTPSTHYPPTRAESRRYARGQSPIDR